ncbi:hypothetical protein [Haloarchaeobius sp. DFWS5]|uniref:hypothetical protein n=1 Tax=Haloarchaeobius sp. DFWS5 TaxID=3446114 RepID=UPI003EBCD48C
MQRRTFIAAAATGLGALSAGCMGADNADSTGTSETDDGTGTDQTDGTSTGTETTTGGSSSADIVISSTDSGQVKVVHMGGAQVTADEAKTVSVTVDGEAATLVGRDGNEHAYFAAKESALGSEETAATNFPISVGNYVLVSAETGSKVAVVATGADDETTTLAEKTVEGSDSGTTTTGTSTTGTSTGTTTTGTETTTGTNTTTQS